jgi:hypothetical protein
LQKQANEQQQKKTQPPQKSVANIKIRKNTIKN